MPPAEALPSRRAAPLAGVGVLVTRPAGRGEGLVERLRAAGAHVEWAPMLAIEPCADADARAALADMARYALVAFVSPSAVEHGLAAAGTGAALAGRAIAAVGEGTRRALEAHGLVVTVVPTRGASARALLAHPALASAMVAGRRILVVKGQGGLPDLEDGLRARGAEVTVARVYRRVPPPPVGARLRERIRERALDVVVITSAEAAENFARQLGADAPEWAAAVCYVVVSERVGAALAPLAPRRRPVVADGAGDEALARAVCGAVARG
ncbi:MAG: uroporphyrinogen-III synthase [Ectothiorhodospiraceae bacterium]|nr:uroporphyrinogen-III synthase [Chromatiales bacterium]MCP5157307.1 uroporphyrinogen-III synthase [Ectothiorhodospiraceae bacterium]